MRGLVDVLGDVLEMVRVDAIGYRQWELAPSSRLRVPAGDTAQFHVLLEGCCAVEVAGQKPLPMSRGDLAVLLHGNEHYLTCASGARPPDEGVNPGRDRKHRHGDRDHGEIFGRDATLASLGSVSIRFDHSNNDLLLSALPPLLALAGESGRVAPWLESTLALVSAETASAQLGTQAVMNRLDDILLVQIVRAHIAELEYSGERRPGWLGALGEPGIGRSLFSMHQQPERSWTVASLAQHAGMSRSAFAARFAELVGDPPLQYLTRFRMQKATVLLREGRFTLAEIADRVGYQSETAFSKAFKRQFGSSPGTYRSRGATDHAESHVAVDLDHGAVVGVVAGVIR